MNFDKDFLDDTYCNGNCCDDFYENYNEDDDNYVIQRLREIISICEFLIEHEKNKKGRKVLDDIIDKAMEQRKEASKEPKRNNDRDRGYKYRVYPYTVPVRPRRNEGMGDWYWNPWRLWF